MNCTGPNSQRMRTPKEMEEVKRLQDRDGYFSNQWENEKKLQAIHETECSYCKSLAEQATEVKK